MTTPGQPPSTMLTDRIIHQPRMLFLWTSLNNKTSSSFFPSGLLEVIVYTLPEPTHTIGSAIAIIYGAQVPSVSFDTY